MASCWVLDSECLSGEDCLTVAVRDRVQILLWKEQQRANCRCGHAPSFTHRPSGGGCAFWKKPNEKDQAHPEVLLCGKIASKKRFIFSLTTVHSVPTQFIFMQNHIPVCQMCTAVCEQLLIYLDRMPSACFFKLGRVGIRAVWKCPLETRNQASQATWGLEHSRMMNQGWISLFQDPPEPPPFVTPETQPRSGSAEVRLSGDSVLPKCAALVNACGKTANLCPALGSFWSRIELDIFSLCFSFYPLASEEARAQNTQSSLGYGRVGGWAETSAFSWEAQGSTALAHIPFPSSLPVSLCMAKGSPLKRFSHHFAILGLNSLVPLMPDVCQASIGGKLLGTS